MDQFGPKSVAQFNPEVAGSCSRSPTAAGSQRKSHNEVDLYLEGRASTFRVESTFVVHNQNEILVEVGGLDSGKHSTVVFPDSKPLTHTE